MVYDNTTDNFQCASSIADCMLGTYQGSTISVRVAICTDESHYSSKYQSLLIEGKFADEMCSMGV